jgi:hypothetical protein
MQGKKQSPMEKSAKTALRKFEQDNNIVDEAFYSYNVEEYNELADKHPWKAEYI